MPFLGATINIYISGGGGSIKDENLDGIPDEANSLVYGDTTITVGDIVDLQEDKADITYVDNRIENLNVDGGLFV